MNENRRPMGAGSVVPLARGPSEPSETLSATQRLDAIDLFCPGASDDERALRRRIQRAQGAAATSAARSQHSRARALYWWTAQFAADWTFQRAEIDELKDIIAGLARAFLVAGMIERLEAPDAD